MASAENQPQTPFLILRVGLDKHFGPVVRKNLIGTFLPPLIPRRLLMAGALSRELVRCHCLSGIVDSNQCASLSHRVRPLSGCLFQSVFMVQTAQNRFCHDSPTARKLMTVDPRKLGRWE